MMAPRATEAKVRRAVKGAMDAGLPIGAVEIMPDGTIRLLPEQQPTDQDMNSVDLVDMKS